MILVEIAGCRKGTGHVPRTRIERLARGETALTTDTALRLARYFGTSPDLWMNLQVAYDLTNDAAAKAAEIDTIVPREAVAASATRRIVPATSRKPQ